MSRAPGSGSLTDRTGLEGRVAGTPQCGRGISVFEIGANGGLMGENIVLGIAHLEPRESFLIV